MKDREKKLLLLAAGILVIIFILVVLALSGADLTGLFFHKGIQLG